MSWTRSDAGEYAKPVPKDGLCEQTSHPSHDSREGLTLAQPTLFILTSSHQRNHHHINFFHSSQLPTSLSTPPEANLNITVSQRFKVMAHLHRVCDAGGVVRWAATPRGFLAGGPWERGVRC